MVVSRILLSWDGFERGEIDDEADRIFLLRLVETLRDEVDDNDDESEGFIMIGSDGMDSVTVLLFIPSFSLSSFFIWVLLLLLLAARIRFSDSNSLTKIA